MSAGKKMNSSKCGSICDQILTDLPQQSRKLAKSRRALWMVKWLCEVGDIDRKSRRPGRHLGTEGEGVACARAQGDGRSWWHLVRSSLD
eukprot:927624-Rhodomonas_salina.1